jgi:hypothetical protein
VRAHPFSLLPCQRRRLHRTRPSLRRSNYHRKRASSLRAHRPAQSGPRSPRVLRHQPTHRHSARVPAETGAFLPAGSVLPCSRPAPKRASALPAAGNQKTATLTTPVPTIRRDLPVVVGGGKQIHFHVRASAFQITSKGLPTCRASGMSAGPSSPRFIRYRFPAAAPRNAVRAGTLLLSEVRLPVQSAGARSPVLPVPRQRRRPHRTRPSLRRSNDHRKRASSLQRHRPAQSGPRHRGYFATNPHTDIRRAYSQKPGAFLPREACCHALVLRQSAHLHCQLPEINRRQR